MRLLYYQHPLILIVQIHHIYLSNQNNKVLYIVACDIWNWGLWEIVQNPPYFRGFLVALPRNVVVVQSLSCVQFLQPHGLQHIRLPCPSLPPPICWDSYPWSWWCYLTFSSSVTPFSSCPQSFPASRSFPMSQRFTSGGQSIGASASVPTMNIQGQFPLGLTGFISLLSMELSRVFFSTMVQQYQPFGTQPSLWSNSDIHIWLP